MSQYRKIEGRYGIDELKVMLQLGKVRVEDLGFVQLEVVSLVNEPDKLVYVAEDQNQFLFDISTVGSPDYDDKYAWQLCISDEADKSVAV